MIRLLRGIYDSLSSGGVLLASFKDKLRYDTFDYHWLVKWDHFIQRTEQECLEILELAGVDLDNIIPVRDDSGVILFFCARRP